MIYPFMTLDDGTEIVHSERKADGRITVHIEKPDAKNCFHTATCRIPDYRWEGIFGFSQEDIRRYEEIIRSAEQTIIRNAAGN